MNPKIKTFLVAILGLVSGYQIFIFHWLISKQVGSDIWFIMTHHTIGVDAYYDFLAQMEALLSNHWHSSFLNFKDSIFTAIIFGFIIGFLIKCSNYIRFFIWGSIIAIAFSYLNVMPTGNKTIPLDTGYMLVVDERFALITSMIAMLPLLVTALIFANQMRRTRFASRILG